MVLWKIYNLYPSGVLLYLINFTFMISMILFGTYQIVLHCIRCPTPQSFTNAYLLITYDKPILTFETADSKATTHSTRFTFIPFSSPKAEVPTLQKQFKKSQSRTYLDPITGIYSLMLLCSLTRFDSRRLRGLTKIDKLNYWNSYSWTTS